MATIYDVAAHAGVSASTVSRVLNGLSTVDPAMAERVMASVQALGYKPNAVARNLRLSSTRLWAVIISDIANPFFTALVRGVEDVAMKAGYSVVLCNSDEDAAKEAHYVGVAQADQMAGVIISPAARSTSVAGLVNAETPVVTIDRELKDSPVVDQVLVDNEDGACRATRHLIESGYRRIACITGPRQLSTAAQRLAGYRRALREAGLAFDRSLVRYADFRAAGANEAMRSLLDQADRPDAVFATNNLMLYGTMECLIDAGVDVPGQVGVVGFDGILWARLLKPSLTIVSQPTYDLGRTAAQLLAERIADPHRAPSKVELKTELHVRESSVR